MKKKVVPFLFGCELQTAVNSVVIRNMKETVIPGLHDTGMSFRTGMKMSLRSRNQVELAPVWHFVLASCQRLQSYEREPGWTRVGTNVALVSRKHPLTVDAYYPYPVVSEGSDEYHLANFWILADVRRREVTSIRKVVFNWPLTYSSQTG